MDWRITLEAVDPNGETYRKEFKFARNLDGLTEGKVGCWVRITPGNTPLETFEIKLMEMHSRLE